MNMVLKRLLLLFVFYFVKTKQNFHCVGVEKAIPIELHIGYKTFKNGFNITKDEFYISYSDSDTV